MKREALRHPKLYDLMARLHCSRPEALGYLELLWDFAKDNAPRGDIGKWPDGSIARACDWSGEENVFVEALVAARWLDRHEAFRLVIHDWHEHAEAWVRAKLTTMKQWFVTGPDRPDKHEPVPTPVATPVPTPVATINRTEPNQTKPNRTGRSAGAFAKLSGSVVKDPRKLLAWFRDNSATVGKTEADALRIFGAAERALELGDKPVALFIDIVKGEQWHLISQAQEDRGHAKLKALRRPDPASETSTKTLTEAVATVANQVTRG